MSILVDDNTTFIVQGITGREAVNLTRECLDYGTGAKIVGGVTPGRLGRDVHGVPVFDTVAQAVEHHGAPDRRLGRHRPPRVHQGRRARGARERRQAGRDRHRADPARRRRPDGRARRRARRADHRPQLPGDHRPRRDQDGRHRRPGQGRRQVLPPRPGRRDLALGRDDDRDVLDADRRRPRPVDRRLDRRRRDHRLELRRADAAVRGRRRHRGDRDLHRARRPDGGRAGPLGDREQLAAADRRLHGRPLHGRDAGHELRPRRHDRRGQGGHRDREDRAPGRRPGSSSPSGSRTSPSSSRRRSESTA